MKSLAIGAALVAAALSPSVASAATTRTATPAPSTQSVWESVSNTEIVNSDGSVTEIHVVTRYYFLGIE
jgi:opacity protein-like surface antigen